MRSSIKVFSLLSILALGACDHYSDKLSSLNESYEYGRTPPEQIAPAAGGAAFNAALAREYTQLATYENDEMYDYTAAKYYTEKAEAAANDKVVVPGWVTEFEIDEVNYARFAKARQNLMNALNTANTPENAEILAVAQTRYDCWLDQQEDNFDGSREMTCKAEFFEAMEKLTREQNMYTITFVPGSTTINPEARQTMQALINKIQTMEGNGYQVEMVSYSGDQVQPLETERISALRSILQFNDVPAENIRVETKTADSSYPAPSSRYVEMDQTSPARQQPAERIDIVLKSYMNPVM